MSDPIVWKSIPNDHPSPPAPGLTKYYVFREPVYLASEVEAREREKQADNQSLQQLLQEALGALGYPVPSDTPTPRFNNGIAEALHQQVADLTAKCEELEREVSRLSVFHCDDEPSWRHRAEKLEDQVADLTAQLAAKAQP